MAELNAAEHTAEMAEIVTDGSLHRYGIHAC